MALNLLSPTIFTTSVLIADTVHTTGGSTDSIPTLTIQGGLPVSAALELQATDAAFLLTRVTTGERDLIPNPCDGMIIFNTSAGVFEFRAGGAWTNVAPGGGDVNGPVASITNDIAIFADTSGKLLADSGVPITAVPGPSFLARFPNARLRAAPLININELSNLGILTFVDPGFISITGGTPLSNYVSVTFNIDTATNLTQTLFVDQNASLVPSSNSALIELSSTTGAFLFSRMTTAQRNALDARDGMMIFNTTTTQFNLFENGLWVPLVTAGGLPWTKVLIDTPLASNNGYIPAAVGLVSFALPGGFAVGDEIRIAGSGTGGGWTITQSPGQYIQFGNISSTLGSSGSISSTNSGDCVELVCITPNTAFAVISSIGNITVN